MDTLATSYVIRERNFTPINSRKKIALANTCEKSATEIINNFPLSLIAAKILLNRGIKNKEEVAIYLKPSLRAGLPIPSNIEGIHLATQLIEEAIKFDHKVAICCDFDVDGLSSGSMLAVCLRKLQIETHVFVPDRFTEGYGLNNSIIQRAKEKGCQLLITLDFGTSNREELLYAKSLGFRSIVIDHHHVPSGHEPVDVFINPQKKSCGFADGLLCAAGLTWYFIAALRSHLKTSAYDPREFLDLACLGTICDMVPLTKVNRVIVKKGLELLEGTNRVGLNALKNVAGIKARVTAYDVSFGLGPRINAAGRIKNGDIITELLTTEDQKNAVKIADKLNRLNSERQESEEKVRLRAIKSVESKVSLPAGIVVWHPDFHTGVIGIVAQRLVEHFYRPSIVLGADSKGLFKGSVRGIKDLSVIEVLEEVKDILLKFGGHAAAGGLTVKEENLTLLELRFAEVCERRLNKFELVPEVEADAEIKISEITIDLIEELEKFAPFGMGNRNPILFSRNLQVENVFCLKDKHLKVIFTDNNHKLSGIFWRCSEHPSLFIGNRVNIAYRPEINSYSGFTNIQANLQAVEDVFSSNVR
jgi:single-stranded-DNA-specific exonuclease